MCVYELACISFAGEPLPDKKVPEFCLEAALYCHRANLEEKLPLAEKQQRVKYVQYMYTCTCIAVCVCV